jgi:hypothetical protein
MTPEQVEAFSQWLQEREAKREYYLQRTFTEHRRLLLKTEIAECRSIREAFERFRQDGANSAAA